MSISTHGSGVNQVQLFNSFLSGGPLRYGAQPPVLNARYDLMVMLDRADLDRGPAFFFQQYYDKLVIVPEKRIALGSSKHSSRDAQELAERGSPGEWYGDTAQPSDRPWFCFWNNTLLEGFIYVTQDCSSPLNSSSPSAAPPNPPPSPSTMAQLPSTWNTYPSIPTTSATAGKRQTPPSIPPRYPKVIKIEERRQAQHAVQPYCQQMQVLYDGSVVQATTRSGDMVIVHLNETESSPPQVAKGSKKGGARLQKKDSIEGGCHCVWVSD